MCWSPEKGGGPVALAESQLSAIWDYGSGSLALMSGHGAHLAP
jgi:hypothetical protein